MTRATQKEFGTRHLKPRPVTAGDTPEGSVRLDWKLMALIAVVFVVGFVWLF